MNINDYGKFTTYVDTICKNKNLSEFKSHPDFTWMLEHVSAAQGNEYLDYIYKHTPLSSDDIRNFCLQNDVQGRPSKVAFTFGLASPSNLRYIFHAHLIFKHIQSLGVSDIDFVEVGGGYGGLAFAIHFFANKYGIAINSYTIIDLPAISELQTMYLSSVLPTNSISTVNALTFGASITKTNMFLISNYCFSEISNDLQIKYREVLFPKVSHGFMAWNHIPTYPFGFSFREEEEYPKTGIYNKYIYF